jgi:hypothetical protein
MPLVALLTVDRLLALSVLLPTAGVVAAGTISATTPTIMRDGGAALGMSLQFADGQKALFKTEDGVSLVMLGSNLPAAGRVTAIAKLDGQWTVTTNRGLIFKQD